MSSRATRAQRERRALERIAYHEAGHAVAALALRRAIRLVSIVPDVDSLGRVRPTRPPVTLRPDINDDQRTMGWIEREILITFAGPAAEAKFIGRYNNIGATSDFDVAVKLASYHHGLGKVLTKYLDYMMARAEQFITVAQQWVQVEDLAAALMVDRVLRPKRVREICRASMADGDRILRLVKTQIAADEEQRLKELAEMGIDP